MKTTWIIPSFVLLLLILTDGNLSSVYKGKTSLDFNDIIPALNSYFESKYPSTSQSVNFTTAVVSQNFWENAHNKRCISIENFQAVEDYLSFRWFGLLGGNQVLVNTPCLGTDSLGNRLTAYFENIVCAHLVGMHYVSLAKVWEPKSGDKPSFFIDALPSNVQHSSPSQKREVKSKMREVCKCQGSCHERISAVWHKGLDVIKPILETALHYHLEQLALSKPLTTTVVAHDLSNSPVGTTLPFIPDVAIHYRCSDNFVGHYGFLPFKHFVALIQPSIPSSTASSSSPPSPLLHTIYVLAENKHRKTTSRKHLVAKCDWIFEKMFTFLTSHFPHSTILIRRGDDLYQDMARLAQAKVTICSVSTFCLWPAIMNNHSAHFPRTKLILGGSSTVDLGANFHWIETPQIVTGVESLQLSQDHLLKRLQG